MIMSRPFYCYYLFHPVYCSKRMRGLSDFVYLLSDQLKNNVVHSPAHSRFARGLAWLRRLLRYLLLFLCLCMDGSTCFTERQRLSLRQQECMRTLFFVASALPHISSPLAL